MRKISEKQIVKYIEVHIADFHKKRLDKVTSLNLKTVLKRKNPYLFKSKAVTTPHDLVKSIADSYLSSQEETLFGSFLEGLAVYICGITADGRKSAAEGIDLDFEDGGIRYLVSIKSGPNWGNSSQIKKMRDNFKAAKKILNTNASAQNVVCVNGCCYGQESTSDKGDYRKLCGQDFWEFISHDANLYINIIAPLGSQARARNDAFHEEYGALLTRMSLEFSNDFCINGHINWVKLVEFVSRSASKKSA